MNFFLLLLLSSARAAQSYSRVNCIGLEELKEALRPSDVVSLKSLNDFKLQVDSVVDQAMARWLCLEALQLRSYNGMEAYAQAMDALVEKYPIVFKDLFNYEDGLLVASLWKRHLARHRLRKFPISQDLELVKAVNALSDAEVASLADGHDDLMLAIAVNGNTCGTYLCDVVEKYRISRVNRSPATFNVILKTALILFPAPQIPLNRSNLSHDIWTVHHLHLANLSHIFKDGTQRGRRLLKLVKGKKVGPNAVVGVCESLIDFVDNSLADLLQYLTIFRPEYLEFIPVQCWRKLALVHPKQLPKEAIPAILTNLCDFILPNSNAGVLLESLFAKTSYSEIQNAVESCVTFSFDSKKELIDQLDSIAAKKLSQFII